VRRRVLRAHVDVEGGRGGSAFPSPLLAGGIEGGS